jgi:hypothetical protein
LPATAPKPAIPPAPLAPDFPPDEGLPLVPAETPQVRVEVQSLLNPEPHPLASTKQLVASDNPKASFLVTVFIGLPRHPRSSGACSPGRKNSCTIVHRSGEAPDSQKSEPDPKFSLVQPAVP